MRSYFSVENENDLEYIEEQQFNEVNVKICQQCQSSRDLETAPGLKSCKECQKYLSMNRVERFELNALKSGLKLKDDQWTFSGTYNKLLENLPDYSQQCLQFQLGLEERLVKNNQGVLKEFNAQIQKRIDAGIYQDFEKLLEKNPEMKDMQKIAIPVMLFLLKIS